MNKRQTIKLNESQFNSVVKKVVKESVKRVLNEVKYIDNTEGFLPDLKRTYGQLKNIHDKWFYADYNPKGMETVTDLISNAMAELEIMISEITSNDIPSDEDPHIPY